MSLDPTRRFTRRADFYSRYRPGYPKEIIRILEREIGFSDEQVVADIGSGTGLLTKIFLRNGNKVFGVEPNDKMRAYAERDLGTFRKFVSVKGTAERTTLKGQSADLITVGQALHWFKKAKTVKEFARISKPGGSLCVVYNEWKRKERFTRAYRRLINRNERYRAEIPHVDAKYMAEFFEHGRYSSFTLPNEQVVNSEGLRGRLLSASYIPSPGEGERFNRFERDVRRLFESYSFGGQVRLLYETELSAGRVRV